MILPKNMIFWVALLIPFAAAAPHSDGLAVLLAVLSATLLAAGLFDAATGLKLASRLTISMPEITRVTFEGDCDLRMRIANSTGRRLKMLLNPLIPLELAPRMGSVALEVPPEELSEVGLACKPVRRGSYTIGHCCFEMDSPLRLWTIRRRNPLGAEVRVYPNLRRDGKILTSLLLNRGLAGLHLQRSIGQGREFEKLRAYVPGDCYASIAWKASAKKAAPISKVFQTERTQEIYAVIDISRLSGRSNGGYPAVEHFINAALMLGIAAERQGDLFGLIAFDDQIRAFLKASNGKPHHTRCRDAIYHLQPRMKSPDYAELFTFVKLRLRRRAMLAFLADLDEPVLADNFSSLVRKAATQHLCAVHAIRDEKTVALFSTEARGPVENLYEHLAGHINWTGYARLGRELGAVGIHLTLSEPSRFVGDVVSEYINIKRRQLL